MAATTSHASASPVLAAGSATALAATVTALHQAGQSGAVLRLDPPGLGHLSVQVGLGAQGQVNLLFVPSTADAAQALQSALPGLSGAMAQSGLTLGQAQVGGQFAQSGGQSGQHQQRAPQQQASAPQPSSDNPPASGLSAYA
ncbi:flagellar hook-length control protein FliK [Acidocella sp. MX-AZ02]|uniref:flagellar hook-length control protein FliK n=2 Tax=unclassified Acidocella TaxID=2648610 RepID=UPI001969AAC5|nr:flagellar hook-length control protein FliK [Acidocella sp. MX-AZ02]